MSAANALSSDPTPSATPEARVAEPSMEDILASIRRIIADDQSRGLTGASPRRSAALNVTPPGARVERGGPSPRPDLVLRPEPARPEAPSPETPLAELFREPIVPPPVAEAPRAARPPAPVVAPSAPPPLTAQPPAPTPEAVALPDLEEHLALISEIAKAGAAAIMNPSSAAGAARDAAGHGDGAPAAAAPPPEAASPEAAPAAAPAAGATVEHVFETVEETQAMQEAEMMAEPDVLVLAGYETAADEVSDALTLSTDPLLSAEVGASVESSFQALANSMFMRHTGAVDGMIRDMLRPLLKTWLDDNLPTIVERLVRAEIERVARGGRG